MERSHHLLVLGLLAALLPAAAATFGTTQPESGASCEPTLLATQVSLFCTPDMPTAQCCEPVVASVDLGGGVPCLCRVAGEPQVVMAGLNATRLLTLYTSCGGLRRGGAHLAAACEGPAPPAAVISAPPHLAAPRRKQPADAPPPPPSTEKPSPPSQQDNGATAHTKATSHYARPAVANTPTVSTPRSSTVLKQRARTLMSPRCDSHSLALALVGSCGSTVSRPGRLCCFQVLRIVDNDCLCDVEDQPVTRSEPLDASHVWFLYGVCRGKRTIPADTTRCESDASPPPPPPPALSPPPPRSPPMDKARKVVDGETIAAYVVSAVLLVFCGITLAAAVRDHLLARTSPATAAPLADEENVPVSDSNAERKAVQEAGRASTSPVTAAVARPLTPALAPLPAAFTPAERPVSPLPSAGRPLGPHPSAPPAPSFLLAE